MKTKQHLAECPETYSNEDDLLECFFSEKINKYCLSFNGKLYTYKTKAAFEKNKANLISTYYLIKTA